MRSLFDDLDVTSEAELDSRLAEINHRMAHESNTVAEEKKMIALMKKLEVRMNTWSWLPAFIQGAGLAHKRCYSQVLNTLLFAVSKSCSIMCQRCH